MASMDQTADFARALIGDGPRVVTAGRDQARIEEGELGIIVSARMSPSGKTVAVLDAVSPQIKTFDASGQLLSAWQPTGFRESAGSAVSAIAVSDSAILISHLQSGTVGLFQYDGTVIRRPERLPVYVLAASALGHDSWLLYGPHTGLKSRQPWLHCVTWPMHGSARVESGFVDSVDARLSIGLPFGLIAMNDGSAIVEHRRADGRVTLVHVACGKEAGSAHDASLRLMTTESELGRGAYDGANSRYFPAGMAIVGESRIVLSLEQGGHTILRLIGRSGQERRLGEFTAPFVILDSRDGRGMLVAANEPWPHLVLIPDSAVLRTIAFR